MKTLSFCVLEGLAAVNGPKHYKFKNDDSLFHLINNITEVFYFQHPLNNPTTNYDKSGYFDCEWFVDNKIKRINEIVESLKEKKYFVVNNFNDCFVIAFAIDREEFEIYSDYHNNGIHRKMIGWDNLDSLEQLYEEIRNS